MSKMNLLYKDKFNKQKKQEFIMKLLHLIYLKIVSFKVIIQQMMATIYKEQIYHK